MHLWISDVNDETQEPLFTITEDIMHSCRLLSLFIGMCMCLSFFTIQTTDKPVLITGYENGQLLLWDVMEQKVMSTKTVHNETGMQ